MKGFELMLDKTDLQILNALSINSRITMKELGEKVKLSGPATSTRIEKLENTGIIEGYTIKINQEKLVYPVQAIINIFIKSTYHQSYLTFLKNQNVYIFTN